MWADNAHKWRLKCVVGTPSVINQDTGSKGPQTHNNTKNDASRATWVFGDVKRTRSSRLSFREGLPRADWPEPCSVAPRIDPKWRHLEHCQRPAREPANQSAPRREGGCLAVFARVDCPRARGLWSMPLPVLPFPPPFLFMKGRCMRPWHPLPRRRSRRRMDAQTRAAPFFIPTAIFPITAC